MYFIFSYGLWAFALCLINVFSFTVNQEEFIAIMTGDI